MNGTTLVLNADAQPVSIVPLSTTNWKDAIGKVFSDRVSVLESYDLWVARSPSVQIQVPSIIMCKEYQSHNGKVEFSRYNLFLRDNYTCQYCLKQFNFDDLTFDHVVPRRQGGKTDWDNIVTACNVCNQEKAHFDKMKPVKAPWRPVYWELAANRKKRPITVPVDSWVDYLCWDSEVIVDDTLRIRNINFEELNHM